MSLLLKYLSTLPIKETESFSIDQMRAIGFSQGYGKKFREETKKFLSVMNSIKNFIRNSLEESEEDFQERLKKLEESINPLFLYTKLIKQAELFKKEELPFFNSKEFIEPSQKIFNDVFFYMLTLLDKSSTGFLSNYEELKKLSQDDVNNPQVLVNPHQLNAAAIKLVIFQDALSHIRKVFEDSSKKDNPQEEKNIAMIEMKEEVK